MSSSEDAGGSEAGASSMSIDNLQINESRGVHVGNKTVVVLPNAQCIQISGVPSSGPLPIRGSIGEESSFKLMLGSREQNAVEGAPRIDQLQEIRQVMEEKFREMEEWKRNLEQQYSVKVNSQRNGKLHLEELEQLEKTIHDEREEGGFWSMSKVVENNLNVKYDEMFATKLKEIVEQKQMLEEDVEMILSNVNALKQEEINFKKSINNRKILRSIFRQKNWPKLLGLHLLPYFGEEIECLGGEVDETMLQWMKKLNEVEEEIKLSEECLKTITKKKDELDIILKFIRNKFN